MTDTASTRLRPRTGTIPDATEYCGLSRSKLYNVAAERSGLFIKWDRRTLVNFDVLDAIIDELPVLTLKPRAPRKPERSKRRR